MNRIEDEFRGRSLSPGRMIVLTPSDAVEMIRRCRERGVPVHGLDAFIIYPNDGIQPSMNDSIDLSDNAVSSNAPNNCWDVAEAFVEKYKGSKFSFEVVVPMEA